VVVVNSTVGLSALFHGRPLKTCGAAIYDIPGLTYRGSLKDFWSAAAGFNMDRELLRRFYRYLISNTQVNGSFYSRLDLPGSHTGLRWSRHASGAALADHAPVSLRSATPD
jgi:capsular polysaccharide export protein